MAARRRTRDVFILGPSVTSGDAALNAVHALYYLPRRFKLLLPKVLPEEKAQYNTVLSLVRHYDFTGRVQFGGSGRAPRKAFIVAEEDDMGGHITGDTPEALASAILTASRV